MYRACSNEKAVSCLNFALNCTYILHAVCHVTKCVRYLESYHTCSWYKDHNHFILVYIQLIIHVPVYTCTCSTCMLHLV